MPEVLIFPSYDVYLTFLLWHHGAHHGAAPHCAVFGNVSNRCTQQQFLVDVWEVDRGEPAVCLHTSLGPFSRTRCGAKVFTSRLGCLLSLAVLSPTRRYSHHCSPSRVEQVTSVLERLVEFAEEKMDDSSSLLQIVVTRWVAVGIPFTRVHTSRACWGGFAISGG